ncbi:MAG: AsmA family protein, partial [Desulfobacterales bacterium]
MRWKKILITAALFLVVLIAAAYVILLNLDFNRYKPRIAQLVFDATGRRLTIDGNIDVALGIRPTLVAENVGLENASWGSQPDLVRVKRLEAQLAFLPLIWGKLDFTHLVLVEPQVIVEFDKAGTSNFAFDTLSEEGESQKIPPPPLIFSDIQIENGFFVYRDTQSDIKFSVRIDRLEGEIEGFDKPLRLDFKGAFDEIPLALEGTVGPIWAWVEPGYPLPANLTATAGGATATITGELRDPINIKGLAFDIAARGSSVAELTRQTGISGVPKFGAFNLTANVNDSAGHLAVEKLDIQIGNQELVAISIAGDLKDVISLRGVNLNFSAHGQDSAQLTQLGLPALPLRGAYRVTAQVSDSEAKVFKVGDLKAVLGENEVNGQLNLNLAQKIPLLTASLTSQKFDFGPFNLDIKMTGPVEKPAINKIDLKLGTSDMAEIRLNGTVDDLMNLQGVDISFQASGKDLANLKKLKGQPLPVRGAFNATGKVLIPVHKKLQISDLKIVVGKNHITGSVDLDLSGARPLLGAKLSSPQLDLPSVLLPNLAKEGWARGLGQVRPVKLEVRLAGFTQDIAVRNIDLRAGSLESAELNLTGSVENLPARRGIDLKFSLKGNEVAKLKEIIAQPYIFAPVPGQGAYALSGQVRNPTASVFEVEDLKFVLADTELTGRAGVNLAGRSPAYEVNVSAPK